MPINANHANRITAQSADGSRDMRTMIVVIIGIIVVIEEIPANQIITITIAIFISAIFPAGIIQQITSFNAAIAVIIQDIGRIGGPVQVPKGDQPIRINI